MNAPTTPEGWQVWDLVLRLGGQFRFVSSGVGPVTFAGWDMSAALALGAAMHIDPALVAEILPEIERVVVAKMNEVGG